MFFRQRPFQTRVFLATAGIAAIVLVSLVTLPQWLARQARLDVLRQHVAEIAELAAASVDGTLHRQLGEPDNFNADLYDRALAPLVRFHGAIPEAFYVYTMVVRDGEPYFVLDTAASPDLETPHKLRASAYMEHFRLREEYTSDWLDQLASGRTWVTPSFQVDDYGYFLTGHAPIRDSAGGYSGFTGVDFDLGYYLSQEARFTRIGWGSVAGVLALSLGIGYLVARYHFALHFEMRRHYESSIRDELTGLLNRRGALEAVTGLSRSSPGHAALLIDVDGLKAINDTLGHAAGDNVITRIAEALRESLRPGDIAARIGGDEFLVIAPDCTPAAAEHMARRIISAVAAPSGTLPRCSVSIGITTDKGTVADFDGLYRQADEALYLAKSDGRNRFAVAPVA
jgi:diguanylate cyclase (GGDEF)-like protein